LNASCTIELPDFTQGVAMQASSPVIITQLPAAGSVISGQLDTLITLIATDVAGNADTCTFQVQTVDHEAPLITTVSASPTQLWPPNHKLRDVIINYTATDNCGSVTSSLAVTSNEPATANHEPDWIIVDNHHIKLRAERSHFNKDRIYTIAITATDSAGNASTQSTTVTVPCFPGENNGLLTVKAFPNPSPNQFIIMTLSTSPKPLNISVTDNTGKLVEKRNGLPAAGLFFLGSNYLPGIYYLEVKQGNSKETIKLIKVGR
jgi:type IX secretion system substrate protein